MITYCNEQNYLTLHFMSSATDIQNRHFLNAEAKALYPPSIQLARLSAQSMLILPRNLHSLPLTVNLIPSSYHPINTMLVQALNPNHNVNLHFPTL